MGKYPRWQSLDPRRQSPRKWAPRTIDLCGSLILRKCDLDLHPELSLMKLYRLVSRLGAIACWALLGSACVAVAPVRILEIGGPTDLVRDPTNSYLYVGFGSVYPYDLDSDEHVESPLLIQFAKRLDLSPDGSRLAGISNAVLQTNPNASWLTIHDLASGQSRDIGFPRLSAHEGGGFDVAFIDDRTLLVTTMYNGSGTVPLRKIDIDSGEVTVIGLVQQETSLEPSGDRSVIAFAEGNSSNGPFGFYDAHSQTLHSGGQAGHHISEIAPDRTGDKFAVPSIGGVDIFDSSFQRVGRLPGQYPQRYPLDALYSPVSDVLYVSWTGRQTIDIAPKSLVAYDATTLQVLETLDAPDHTDSREFRQLMISRNGRELYALMGNQ